jgi:hypothetical protein
MDGTPARARALHRLVHAIACALSPALLASGAAHAQSAPLPPSGLIPAGPSAPAPPPLEGIPPEPERSFTPAPEMALELSLRGGVSVATIQVDGAAATAFLPGGALEFRQGMLLAGASFDLDPGVSDAGEDRSGWHLGAQGGAAFQLSATARLDLLAELGVHHLEESLAQASSSYATSASLPYFGVRPAISAQFGSGNFLGAVGAAVFFRVDAGQRQPNGLPDDGGHQLGAEAFLSLRVPLFAGK